MSLNNYNPNPNPNLNFEALVTICGFLFPSAEYIPPVQYYIDWMRNLASIGLYKLCRRVRPTRYAPDRGVNC